MTHDEQYNPEPKHQHIIDLTNYLNGFSGGFKIRESPEYMMNLAKECNIELDMDNIDTNGWQVDYWINGSYKNKKLLISGSAWYGYAEISFE